VWECITLMNQSPPSPEHVSDMLLIEECPSSFQPRSTILKKYDGKLAGYFRRNLSKRLQGSIQGKIN